MNRFGLLGLSVFLALAGFVAPASAQYRVVASCPGAVAIQPAGTGGATVVVDVNGNLCSSGTTTTTAPIGTLTDRSGTITAGTTAQTLAPVNASRKYLFVENPCAATESLWINFTTAAVRSQPSIELAACGSFLMQSPNFISTELISVNATTTGHAFIAKEN